MTEFSRVGRAAQYMRMSTEYQRYSPDNQAAAIAHYAATHGFEIVKTYIDAGRSGLNIEGRPALQKLIADAQNYPSFEAILVYDVSRWGRFQDVDESAYYEYVCSLAGIKVHYCAEDFGPHGGLLHTILKSIKRAMAGEYSRALSKVVYDGQVRLFRDGYHTGGTCTFGLHRMLVHNDNHSFILKTGERKALATDRVKLALGSVFEVELIRAIYRLAAEQQMAPGAISRILNARGYVAADGRPWTRSRVHSVLTSERYVGVNVYGKTNQKLKHGLTPVRPEDWHRVDAAFDPVISKELFDRVKRIFESRSRHYWDSRRTADTEEAPEGRLEPVPCRAADVKSRSHAEESSSANRGFRYHRHSSDRGWCAKIIIGGTMKARYFSDKKYGSREKARLAAESAGFHDPRLLNRIRGLRIAISRGRLTDRDSSGVRRTMAKGRHVWQALWREPDTSRRVVRRFSIEKYGEEGARRLAFAAKKEALARIAQYCDVLVSKAHRKFYEDSPPPPTGGGSVLDPYFQNVVEMTRPPQRHGARQLR